MSAREDFWSRRKARVAQEEAAEVEAVEAAKLAEDRAALEQKSDEEILQELGLPDPDTLQKGDNFSGFMAKAVPDRIRRRALRKLWTTNPALANLDGLLDYGEDFTDSAKVIENLQTAYQVGKGMLEHVEELARQEAEKEKELVEAPLEGEVAEDALDEIPEGKAPVLAAVGETAVTESEYVAATQDESDLEIEEMDDHLAPAPRRRMRFAFQDQSGGVA